jgi:hypothetical protein
MLAKVGISVPGANENAGTHPDERGTSSTITHATPDSTTGKGAEISELARTTELTGVDKGATVSSVASSGKSHAGQNSSASGGAAVDTPNGGGTGTADTASGGNSSPGTSKADTASDGHSSSGSGNASDGQDTAESASGGHSSAGSGNRP